MGAALSALVCGSAVFADTPTPAAASDATPVDSSYYLQTSGPTSLTPIMFELSNTSVGKWMTANNLSITGFAEGGYFLDTDNGHMGNQHGTGPGAIVPTKIKGDGDAPTDIGFGGIYSNRPQLDQLDVTIAKSIPDATKWDWGFTVEQGYGTDDAQIHSDGMLDSRGNTVNGTVKGISIPGAGFVGTTTQGPDNQYDIVQANVSMSIPIGNGLTIKAGKFVTLLGYEYINPTLNAFYTHSYLFSFGIPLTQTGVLASYTFPKLVNGQDWTFTAGITRGWNQSTLDNNGEPDFLGEMSGNITSDGKLAFTFNMSEGPEATHDNSDYWTVLELIPTYKFSDQLSFAMDTLFGDFPHGSGVDVGHQSNTQGTPPLINVYDGRSDCWYAVAPYAAYKLNSYVTFNARGEWYRDQGGYTLGNLNSNSGTDFYEVTLNAQIKPLPNSDLFQWLQFRPEVRYDWASHKSYNGADIGGNGTQGQHNELTFAVDAIMQF